MIIASTRRTRVVDVQSPSSAAEPETCIFSCNLSLSLLLLFPDGAKFGYSGSVGPDHWGALSPSFRQCATGTKQSPIDISTAQAVSNPALQPLHRDYTVANATLVDNVVNVAVCRRCLFFLSFANTKLRGSNCGRPVDRCVSNNFSAGA